MKRVLKILAVYLGCVLLFSGCARERKRDVTVVTGVQITCCSRGQTIRCAYTDPEKVRRVLYYLRQRETAGYARGNPERILGDTGKIELQLSGGGSRVFRIRGDRYVSVDGRPWKNVDPAWGRRLYYLLQLIPPDPVANPAAG